MSADTHPELDDRTPTKVEQEHGEGLQPAA